MPWDGVKPVRITASMAMAASSSTRPHAGTGTRSAGSGPELAGQTTDACAISVRVAAPTRSRSSPSAHEPRSRTVFNELAPQRLGFVDDPAYLQGIFVDMTARATP